MQDWAGCCRVPQSSLSSRLSRPCSISISSQCLYSSAELRPFCCRPMLQQEKHGVMDEELEEHPKLCLTMLCPSEWHCVSRLQRAEMLGMLSLIPHTLLPKYILRWRQFTAPKLHIWDVFISGLNSEHPIGMYEPLCTFLSILCCRQVCGGITHLTGLYLGQGASLLLFFRSRKPHQLYTSRQRRSCKQDFGE